MITFLSTHLILIGLMAFAIGWIFMPIVIKIAKKQNFVVRPNKRMCHTGEVPNIGGIDICVSFLFIYLLFAFDQLSQSQFFLIGIFTIVLVGFIDDILVLSPLAKLAGEILAGIILICFSDFRITHLHYIFGIAEIGLIPSYLLSLLILLTITNAINLIDGVDGLASGLGILYCLFFSVWFMLVGETVWAILATGLIGVLAVFFCYNVFGKKHKIFMGDSGSLLLGFTLTAFTFRFCELNAYHQIPDVWYMKAAPAVVMCVFSVPLFDLIRVSLTRIKHRCSPFDADKNHIHHLLLRTGLNHIQTTGVLLTVSIICIGVSIIGRNWNFWVLLVTDLAICTFLTLVLWRKINKKLYAQH